LTSKDKDAWQPTRKDKSERLLQLTCALLFAERGLNKQQLFSAILGYAAANEPGNEDALNRMFERDKAELRDIGVQIETQNPNGDPEDLRYIIASDSFIWPKHIELTPKQLQLLDMAAQAWAQASLQSEANQGLVRLRALGIAPASSELLGFAPRIRTHEPSFYALTNAIEDRTVVSFNYRKPDGSIEERTVEPWALKNIGGQWMLQCFDLERGQSRNFLLKRITSKISLVKLKDEPIYFDQPDSISVQQSDDSLAEFISKNVAELRVKRDSQAWFHFQLDDEINSEEQATVRFEFMDLHLLAEELRDFALDIKVIQPKELDEAIKSGFAKVAADHA
jgi:proteasome accessory factor B